jgi:hypothetical protein
VEPLELEKDRGQKEALPAIPVENAPLAVPVEEDE